MGRLSHNGDKVLRARNASLVSVLDALQRFGSLVFSRDLTFRPINDYRTERFFVTLACDGHTVELLVTDSKCFDVRMKLGGGGAIDLYMYLFNVSFVVAVRALGVLLTERPTFTRDQTA